MRSAKTQKNQYALALQNNIWNTSLNFVISRSWVRFPSRSPEKALQFNGCKAFVFLILYRKPRNGYRLGTNNTKNNVERKYNTTKEARQFQPCFSLFSILSLDFQVYLMPQNLICGVNVSICLCMTKPLGYGIIIVSTYLPKTSKFPCI